MNVRCIENTLIKKKKISENHSSDNKCILYEEENFEVKKGDKIFIEYSHKFSEEKVKDLASESNLFLKNTWFTDDKYFMFCSLLKEIKTVWRKSDEIFEGQVI